MDQINTIERVVQFIYWTKQNKQLTLCKKNRTSSTCITTSVGSSDTTNLHEFDINKRRKSLFRKEVAIVRGALGVERTVMIKSDLDHAAIKGLFRPVSRSRKAPRKTKQQSIPHNNFTRQRYPIHVVTRIITFTLRESSVLPKQECRNSKEEKNNSISQNRRQEPILIARTIAENEKGQTWCNSRPSGTRPASIRASWTSSPSPPEKEASPLSLSFSNHLLPHPPAPLTP